MTSNHETEADLKGASARTPELPASYGSELAYDRLTGYGFARRYVGGKVVADVGWAELGRGSRLLAETAGSVAGLTGSPEAAERASALYPASNVGYQRVALPQLPYAEGHFDVVVALGVVENLERPEELVAEARRVLKPDGVLVISSPVRRTDDRYRGGTEGRRGMYALEFQELLERHFGHVHVYRQGAVAGGLVYPASEEVAGAPVESARFSATDPSLAVEPPATRSVVAVCSDVEALGRGEQPYLLLDRDRRVFDECEERAEDVELLRDEVRRVQETEVQAFRDALKLHRSTAYVINRYLTHLRSLVRAMQGRVARAIKRRGVIGVARVVLQRLSSRKRRPEAENKNPD